MNVFDNHLRHFKPISPDHLSGLTLSNHLVRKFICLEQQIPDLLQSIPASFRIIDFEGEQVAAFQQNNVRDVGALNFAQFKKKGCELGSESKVFSEFERVILTNKTDWITIDFHLHHCTYSGWLVLFDTLVVLTVYVNAEHDDLSLVETLSEIVVSGKFYNRFDINLLLLYSLLRLNMTNASIQTVGGLFSSAGCRNKCAEADEKHKVSSSD